MVMDRDRPAHRAVIAAYAQRNACAHGTTTVSVSSIDALIQNLYLWQSQLRG
ncbi:MAG: hypothetical protein NXI21_00140 [Alphaproteobacteria bacterium]|nr:hypothetical protein [Alphaproteobacteria bacterium]